MCFRKHLCNLDASCGSCSLGSLVNLDLNPNSTACDIVSPLCNVSLALISSSTSLPCAPCPKSIHRQRSAFPPSSTTTHMHQFFCELSYAAEDGWGSSCRLAVLATELSAFSQFHFLHFSGLFLFPPSGPNTSVSPASHRGDVPTQPLNVFCQLREFTHPKGKSV